MNVTSANWQLPNAQATEVTYRVKAAQCWEKAAQCSEKAAIEFGKAAAAMSDEYSLAEETHKTPG